MKYLAISYKGMEDITALEIKELLNVDSKIKPSCVIFEVDDIKDYCNKAQGVNRVLILLDSFKIKKIEDLARIENIDWKKYLKGSFAARCSVVENDFSKNEVERTTGDYVEGKVDLENPDKTVFVYIYKDDCYVGIDVAGDLSKREYKIITGRDDIKGTIAYAMVRLSGFTGKEVLVDPFCNIGTVVIEAGLFASGIPVKFKKINGKKTEVYGFADRLRAVEQNSAAAGIKKYINLGAGFDLFDKVDCIVSNVPRFVSERDYNDLFRNAKHVLKGNMVLCSSNPDKLKEIAKEEGFKIEEREIEHGKEILKITIYKNQ